MATGAGTEMIATDNKRNAADRIPLRTCMVARVYRETLISGIWIDWDPFDPSSRRSKSEFGNILQGRRKFYLG